ncbi:MAG TPA: ATP-binding protein [Bacteroidota bacterium]|nr:ATP-binding protein [Bacteroidota bacterium]
MKSTDTSDRPSIGAKRKRELQAEAVEILKSLNLIVGLDQLLEILCARLKEIFGSGTITISLFDPITRRYAGMMARGRDAQSAPLFGFFESSSLIRWLNINQTPLNVRLDRGVFEYLASEERLLLESHHVALVVPLIALNRLTGILFLSEKEDGTLYNKAELDPLLMVAAQASLALENAVMTQFQEERLKKLFHADKLATVGELAAGAAHEIRNPLTSIRSTVQFLKRDIPQEKHGYVDGVIEEVDRIDGIIRGLLSLSKSSELHLSRVDIRELMQQTLMLLDGELKRNRIEVRQETPIGDPSVEADQAQLKQVFLNVLLNSVQAMPSGGTILVQMTDRPDAKSEESFDSVWVTLSDTGPGMREETIRRAFDPFFTTKENGTGLGLSITYGIVHGHGGEIDISSKTDPSSHGTTATIRLPRKATRT